VLKHRVLTALVLIPIVIWGIFQLSTFPAFATVLGLFVVLGVLEWTRLIHISDSVQRMSYVAVLVACLLASLVVMQSGFWFAMLLLASVAWWAVQLSQLSNYDGSHRDSSGFAIADLWAGIALLVPTWAALVFIHQHTEHGSGLVLFLMILIWTADSGAYFVGRKFGKNKLAPLISPGKSKEGAYGALAASGIVSLIGAFWLELDFFQFIFFLLLCQLVVIFSIGGDLLESVYKRRAGVKDSGTLLPGHGGVLDRIDSMMAASPLFALGIWLLGIIE